MLCSVIRLISIASRRLRHRKSQGKRPSDFQKDPIVLAGEMIVAEPPGWCGILAEEAGARAQKDIYPELDRQKSLI